MNTTNETIFNMDNNEVTTVKPYIPFIVQKLRYLFSIRVTFDARFGLKAIHGKLERHPMTSEVKESMKEFFDSNNLKPHESGQYPVPENLEQYRYLEFVDFSEDYCSFTPKEVQNLNSIDAKLYAEAVEKYNAIYKESEGEKLLKSYGLEIPKINTYATNLTIVGNTPVNLEEITLNIPEITDGLPYGARIIKYCGTLYFYVTSPCMFKLVFEYANNMNFTFIPLFYQTFVGGIPTAEDAKYDLPCENLPLTSYFERLPERAMALAITSWKDYVNLIEQGIYQKYKPLTQWNDYDFYINYYFSKPSNAEVDKFFEGYTVSRISILSHEDLVSYVKNDVQYI